MTSDSTVVPLRLLGAVDDPLTAILRSGARQLLAEAVEAEAEAFLVEMRTARLADGRERLVRHGHGPERLVQTGIGPVPVQRVKLRDRGTGVEGERIRFTSRPTLRVGNGATWQRGGLSPSGRTASTCRHGWSRKLNACWC